jgi:hypothetical protein
MTSKMTMAIATLGGAGLVAAAAACGTTAPKSAPSSPPSSSQPSSSQPSSSQPSSSPSSNPSLTGPAGTTYEITGPNGPNGETTTYQVTMTHVLQQAQLGAGGSLTHSGYHVAGVQFTVTGKSGQTSDNANRAATAIGSNGQTYTSEFDEITAGTNFNNGDINISPGQSLNGWVSFELPAGVSIASVQWHPGTGGEAVVTWTVGS